jgi:hypothetical protein
MRIDPSERFGTRECPSCACEVAANNNRCPVCGYAFPTPTPVQRRLRWWGALVMLAILAVLALSSLL